MSDYEVTISLGGEPLGYRVTLLNSVIGKGRLLAGFYDHCDALGYAKKLAKKHGCQVENLCADGLYPNGNKGSEG